MLGYFHVFVYGIFMYKKLTEVKGILDLQEFHVVGKHLFLKNSPYRKIPEFRVFVHGIFMFRKLPEVTGDFRPVYGEIVIFRQNHPAKFPEVTGSYRP